jgi:hypothetical protein
MSYHSDPSKIEFFAEDGYCFGSIESKAYQIDGVKIGKDQNGFVNSTI